MFSDFWGLSPDTLELLSQIFACAIVQIAQREQRFFHECFDIHQLEQQKQNATFAELEQRPRVSWLDRWPWK